jgi:hypothetical protein
MLRNVGLNIRQEIEEIWTEALKWREERLISYAMILWIYDRWIGKERKGKDE